MKTELKFSLLGVVLLAIIFIFSINANESISGNSYVVLPNQQTIIPTVTYASSEESSIDAVNIQTVPDLDTSSIFFVNNFVLPVFSNAFAISSIQETITVKQWNVQSLDFSANHMAQDSSGNIFISGGNKIGFLDINTDSFTKCTVPNDGEAFRVAADISGNAFFVDRESQKISRLDPSTNVFTLWDMMPLPSVEDTTTDFSGNFYFNLVNQIGKLDPSTNTITLWNTGFTDMRRIILDGSGHLYFNDVNSRTVSKLNLATNEITSWQLIEDDANPINLAIDPSGNIYFPLTPDMKIAKLDTTTNVLTTWRLPIEFSSARVIAVDSVGNIFTDSTAGPEFLRLVPSTNTFTEWENKPFQNTGTFSRQIIVDPSDVVYFRDRSVVGFVT